TLTLSASFDTFLAVYNSSLTQVASDHASLGNGSSQVNFTLQSGQIYYIEATSFNSGVTGAYTLNGSVGAMTATSNPFTTNRPTAVLNPVTPPSSGSTFDFSVTYTDSAAVNVSTLDGNDIRVTGPNGYNQLASFISVSPSGNGTPRTATYR